MLISRLSKESLKLATQAFANVIKNHVTFNSQFCIEGTLGITIDKDKVMLLHFDEIFPKSRFESNFICNPSDDFDSPTLEIITLSPDHHGFEDTSPFLSTDFNSSSTFGNDYSKMMRCPINTAENKHLTHLEKSIPIDSDDSMDSPDTLKDKQILSSDFLKPIIRISKNDCKNVKKLLRNKIGNRNKHKALGRIVSMQSNISDHSGYAKTTHTRSMPLSASKHEEDMEADSNNEPKKEHISTGYICDVCNERFQRLGRLESHLVTKHSIVENEKLGKITHFSCQFCKKIYRFQAELDKHIVSHKKRPYHCLYCRNTYRHPETLSLHVQVHSGQLKCGPCNKVYQSKLHFQKHLVYMHEKLDVQ